MKQESLFQPQKFHRCAPADLPIQSDWKPPDMNNLPRLWEAKRVAVDLETFDPGLNQRGGAAGWATGDGKLVGVGFATDDHDPIYLPFGHGNGTEEYGNVSKVAALRYVKDVMESSCDKIFFNEMYDRGWLQSKKYKIGCNGNRYDASTAIPLIDENRPLGTYNLDAISRDWLGTSKDERLIEEAAAYLGKKNPKAILWQLHSRYVGPYGEKDPLLHLRVWDECVKRLDEQDLWEVFGLEMSLTPVLIKMRMRGVPVDVNDGDRILATMASEGQRIRDRFEAEYGFRLPHSENSGAEIAAVADSLGLDYPTTDEGNPSFVKDWLKAQEHPLFRGVMSLRECSKVESLVRSQLEEAVNGRIHCELNPLKNDTGGTITYRFSSSNPNLQQVPSRGRWGKIVRSLYLPEEGCEWAKADYSEQEYRLMVQYAYWNGCTGSSKAVKAYQDGHSFHTSTTKWMGWHPERDRWRAKILNFGMSYAMTDFGVAKQLGSTREEAMRILDQYHQNVPFVRELDNLVKAKVRRTGWIQLMYGHKCHFDRWEPAVKGKDEFFTLKPLPLTEAQEAWPKKRLVRAFLRKSLNKLIQGSGAGMIKQAMVECDAAGILPALQVHDELDTPVSCRGEADKIRDIMCDVANAKMKSVPIKVDVDLGPNWGGKPFDELLEDLR